MKKLTHCIPVINLLFNYELVKFNASIIAEVLLHKTFPLHLEIGHESESLGMILNQNLLGELEIYRSERCLPSDLYTSVVHRFSEQILRTFPVYFAKLKTLLEKYPPELLIDHGDTIKEVILKKGDLGVECDQNYDLDEFFAYFCPLCEEDLGTEGIGLYGPIYHYLLCHITLPDF